MTVKDVVINERTPIAIGIVLAISSSVFFVATLAAKVDAIESRQNRSTDFVLDLSRDVKAIREQSDRMEGKIDLLIHQKGN